MDVQAINRYIASKLQPLSNKDYKNNMFPKSLLRNLMFVLKNLKIFPREEKMTKFESTPCITITSIQNYSREPKLKLRVVFRDFLGYLFGIVGIVL